MRKINIKSKPPHKAPPRTFFTSLILLTASMKESLRNKLVRADLVALLGITQYI